MAVCCVPRRGRGPSGRRSDMATDWPNQESPADEFRTEASESGGLLRDLEDELCRLGGVLAVRVVGDRSDRPIEVHVLSDQSKTPKQTVRDVRSVAHTVFGIELDHRIVSVAQLDTADADVPASFAMPTAERRARVGSVHVDSDGLRAEVRVTLADSEHDHVGYAEGSVAAVARP